MNTLITKTRLGRITKPTFGFDDLGKLCEFRFVADFGNNESALIRVRDEVAIRIAMVQLEASSSEQIEGKFAKFEQDGGKIEVVEFMDAFESRSAENQFLF